MIIPVHQLERNLDFSSWNYRTMMSVDTATKLWTLKVDHDYNFLFN